jgi:hypothetical protein
MTPRTHSDRILVAAPAEHVYDLVADITRMGGYSPVCKECWWDEGDRPTVGAHFTGRNVIGDRTWETRSEVVAADRGREFAWVTSEGMVRWGYTFATADGRTEVTESWAFLPRGEEVYVERFGDDAEAQVAARYETLLVGIPATLAAIKAAAEATAA